MFSKQIQNLKQLFNFKSSVHLLHHPIDLWQNLFYPQPAKKDRISQCKSCMFIISAQQNQKQNRLFYYELSIFTPDKLTAVAYMVFFTLMHVYTKQLAISKTIPQNALKSQAATHFTCDLWKAT